MSARRGCAALAAIVMAVAATIAAAPDLQPPPGQAATLSGSVVVEGAGKGPARDAIVMIAGTDVGLVRATATDSTGRFAFEGLPPGHFIVSAGRSRYLPAMYGASRRGRPGTIVAIRAGDAITNVRLELEAGAVIAGRVIDDQGRPLVGARVRVLGRRQVGTEIALTGDAGDPSTVTTDDRGAYRVFNLAAGEYVVGVQPRGITAGDARVLTTEDVDRSAPAPATTPGANGAAIGYGPVYYPAAQRAEQASVITVAAGEERSGIDIRQTLDRFARIDGTLLGTDQPAPPHQITLRPRGFEASGTILYAQNVRAAPDGHFSFTNVPPGDYTILARTLPPPNAPGQPPAPPPPPSWALADISVHGVDVSGVSLTWQPSLTVSGRVTLAGQSQLPDDVRVRVGLRSTPASNVPSPPDQIPVDASGRFTITGVLPGRYWLTTTIPANPVTQVPEWFARSAIVNAVDALDVAFEVTPGSAPDIVLTLTEEAQQIDGTVRRRDGHAASDYPVIVFPVDRRLWFPQSRRIVVRRSNDAGELLFGLASALPPGEYSVAVAPDLGPNEQYDPGLLSDLMKTAVRVTLGPNDSRTIALVVSR